MHSSVNADSFFLEEVVSNFWEVVGLLDKLLVLFSPIDFLDSNAMIVDKLLVLFDLVIFFVSSLILK